MVISDFFILLLAVMACFQVTARTWKCSDCKDKYKAVGCYDDGRYIRLRERMKVVYTCSSYHCRRSWEHFMERSACRCAKMAKRNGHNMFGIKFGGVHGKKFYGECWTGSRYSYSRNFRKVPDKECIGSHDERCTIWSRHCVGIQSKTYIYQIVPDCDIPLKRLGCYADNHHGNRPLPEYYLTDRDNTRIDIYSNKTIDWRNWDVYLPDLVCRCARKAKEMGRTTFGVQFYGECWTGPKGDSTYNKDGPSENCVDRCFQPCRRSYGRQKYCTGENHANFVYRIIRH